MQSHSLSISLIDYTSARANQLTFGSCQILKFQSKILCAEDLRVNIFLSAKNRLKNWKKIY